MRIIRCVKNLQQKKALLANNNREIKFKLIHQIQSTLLNKFKIKDKTKRNLNSIIMKMINIFKMFITQVIANNKIKI